jgi:2-polyprenyl-3-methyl-5-hydroxy-6-metoxy-1,4-benzoquinol methylase
VDLDDPSTFQRHIAASRPTIPKDEWIVGMASGREVLDLGCIDHSVDTALGLGDAWLHHRLQAAAARLVGLDLLVEDAEALSTQHGYDIRPGDAEDFHWPDRFDVIVAGDLIEHLSNPGRFLECVAEHLAPGGRAVVTTPNPFNIEQVIQALVRNQVFVNPEHALWLDPRTMHQLVARSPLRIDQFHWIDTRFHFHLRGGRIARRVLNPLMRGAMRYRPLVRRDFGVVLVSR